MKKINYLCFEGGGGRGATYLGAIKALEQDGFLPIAPPSFAALATEVDATENSGSFSQFFLNRTGGLF